MYTLEALIKFRNPSTRGFMYPKTTGLKPLNNGVFQYRNYRQARNKRGREGVYEVYAPNKIFKLLIKKLGIVFNVLV